MQFEINGLSVDAEYDANLVDGVLIPMLREWTDMQRHLARRMIVFMAAPPGAGKSTLAAYLAHLSAGDGSLTTASAAGMDGFHHFAAYLKSHRTVRDGREILLDEIKGAPETFDTDRMRGKLDELRRGGAVSWPTYDRLLHDVVPDAYTVDADIVIFEGNYLLMDAEPWSSIRAEYCDSSVYIEADPEALKPRLIARKVASGHSPEEAAAFYEFSDGVNVRTVIENTSAADRIIRI